MNKDMHKYLENLERDMPEQVIRVKKEVASEFEIPAILQQVESRKKYPVIFFEKVRNLNGNLSSFPVIINLFGSRERLAYAIDSTVQDLPFKYVDREKPIAPVIVDKSNAKVKEVVQTGKAVDLYELPFITHNEMDLGPYITAGSAWVRDPETNRVNCAIIRILVDGPKRLVVNFNPVRHTNDIFQKYKKLGIPVPMAIVIGHHPAFYLGAQTKLFVNEPEIIGGVMNEALEIIPSETWGNDLMVPAQAEVIIEAELSTSELDIEAPFGEFTGYSGGQKLNPTAEVTAISRRKNAWYLTIMPGHADHLLLDIPVMEAYLYSRIKAVVDGTVAVHVPLSGAGRFHAYVQIKKTNDAQPNVVIATAISSEFRIKHVIVVDEDIDIFDDEQVLWAIATRSQWDKDLVVIPNMVGSILDPTTDFFSTSKGGIDATKPANPREFSKKLSLPSSVMERIKLENFLEPEILEHL